MKETDETNDTIGTTVSISNKYKTTTIGKGYDEKVINYFSSRMIMRHSHTDKSF